MGNVTDNTVLLHGPRALRQHVARLLTAAGIRTTQRGTDPYDVAIVALERLADAPSLVETYGLAVIALGYWSDPSEVASILNAGVADYVALPAGAEIVVRVRALRRRLAWACLPATVIEPIVEGNGLRIDYSQREIRVDGLVVKLTPREWKILWFLVRNVNGQSRGEIQRHVWGPESEWRDENAVRVYVAYLRSKLGRDKIVTDGRWLPEPRYRLVLEAS